MPSLTGNTALDVAIGLSFVYVLFSVLCSAAQEGIASILDLRARTLEQGLRNLLEDNGEANTGGAPTAVAAAPAAPASPPAPEVTLTQKVLGQGLIRTMYKESGRLLKVFGRQRRGPSYIPADTFALALLNVVAPISANNPLADIRTEIAEATWIPAGPRNALLVLARDAGADRYKLRKGIEEWFNATMDRVSGWYKRQTQVVICILSLIVAVGLNVNTVSIADRLMNDDTVRAAVAQAAATSAVRTGESLNAVANQITQVEKLGVPFGWNKRPGDPAQASFSHHLGRTLIGWLLTFLALSLGAPFWFDALSKLAALRGTGAPPTASGAAGSAD